MNYLKALLLVPLCWSAPTLAQTIEEIFPYTVQSHSASGVISMNSHAAILGEGRASGLVEFKRFNNNHQHARCYGDRCYVDNDFSATVSVDFNKLKDREDVYIIDNAHNVENHEVFGNGSGEDLYIINGDLDVKPHGRVGGSNNGALVFVNGNANIKGQFYGYLYATGDITLQTPHGDFCGRVSSRDLTMQSHAEIDSSNSCSYDFSWFDKEQEQPTLDVVEQIGYVNGEDGNAAKITIASSGAATEQEFQLSYGGGELSYKRVGDSGPYTPLANNGDYRLPLNTPLYIKYNRPTALPLTLIPKAEGQAPQSVELAFVPYRVEVQPAGQCPPVGDAFIYADHSGCPVLARAGESTSVPLTFLAYGVDGSNDQQGAELPGYNFNLPEEVTISEPSAGSGSTPLDAFDDEIGFTQVTLVKAVVADHCASYADNCGNRLTKGSSANIGRTVPASLRVKESVSGDLEQNVVYAAQPDPIGFARLPGFVVEGLDTNGNSLPSYSGEFAGGLKANSEFWLDSILSSSPMKLAYSEPESGQHLIELDPDGLILKKELPFAETSLAQPLQLTIGGHDHTQGVDDETTLADEQDRLRYGFLTLEDTELPINTDGHIRGQLYYLDKGNNPVPETENHFSFASHIKNGAAITATATKPEGAASPSLAVDNDGNGLDGIIVTGYQRAAEFEVELEVDQWLQPHDGDTLVSPSARLNITEERRKHANDRTFNRREVVR
ncbi:DUF6701 domain-containing protein [Zobellella aerophila]|uniref:DUF6701 domain-containing protein n=1 Tax=Zobellella aerophila TaxID=870480 RepID=A0ABP6V876_9GAMM